MSESIVYITHLDNSVSEPQQTCIFWGIEECDWSAYVLMKKNIASIQQALEVNQHPRLTIRNSKTALDVLEQLTCCVLKDDQWQRARIIDPELSHAWTVEAFFLDSGVTSPVLFSAVRSLDFWEFLVEDVREWPALATKYCLAPTHYLAKGTLWNEEMLKNVKSKLVNRTWKAVPICACLRPSDIGDNQFVNLYSSDKSFTCVHIITPPSLPRSYTNKKISSNGRHDVIISHVAQGPSEFYLQLKSEAGDILELREGLSAEIPLPFTGVYEPGTVCTAVSSVDQLLHRGSIYKPTIGSRCAIFFPDIGIREFVDTLQVFDIPDKLLVVHSLAYRASLFRSEELEGLEGLFDLFSSLVNSVTHLTAEVVEECGISQKVNLYDGDGRSLMEILNEFFIDNPAPIENVLAPAVQLPRRLGKYHFCRALYQLHTTKHFYYSSAPIQNVPAPAVQLPRRLGK